MYWYVTGKDNIKLENDSFMYIKSDLKLHKQDKQNLEMCIKSNVQCCIFLCVSNINLVILILEYSVIN